MAKTPTKTTSPRSRKVAPAKTTPKSVVETRISKQNIVLAMLRRANGASIAEMMAATGWQAHSVRGFMSGALKKRLGLPVVSVKTEAGERRYHIAVVKQG